MKRILISFLAVFFLISVTSTSADGHRIAFLRSGNIYVMDADGRNQIRLTTGGDSRQPAWSPDGRHIAFYSDLDGDDEIFVINADGSNLTQLTNNLSDDYSPAWSPDGNRIAFLRGEEHQNFVMDADGKNITLISDNLSAGWSPRGSPDGHQYVYSALGDGGMRIFIVDVDGSNRQQLANAPLGAHDRDPAWSPNGRYIAFSRSGNIYVMDADGSNQIILTLGGDNRQPTWSPDGRYIAFFSILGVLNPYNLGEIRQIFVMDADGSNQRQLTTSGDNLFPVWCPAE
jgi:Tol biopolymer transport system component